MNVNVDGQCLSELSLFTGAGGGLLGSRLLSPLWRTVGAVEIDKFCCERVGQRRDEGHLGSWFPIWNMGIREFNRRIAPSYTGLVDLISAGFPCQPFSAAGKRLGANDPRNMWPATIECIRVVRPQYVFLENVPGLFSPLREILYCLLVPARRLWLLAAVETVFPSYFGRILRDLAESGYDARWRVLSAAEMGAPHKRDRLWIVADANVLRRGRRPTEAGREAGVFAAGSGGWDSVANTAELQFRREPHAGADCAGHPCARAVSGQEAVLADTTDKRSESLRQKITQTQGTDRTCRSGQRLHDWWKIEPDVGRVAHGVASRVDRLKALGNGQVPIVAATAWEILSEMSD